jgi:hypothetical protein
MHGTMNINSTDVNCEMRRRTEHELYKQYRWDAARNTHALYKPNAQPAGVLTRTQGEIINTTCTTKHG